MSEELHSEIGGAPQPTQPSGSEPAGVHASVRFETREAWRSLVIGSLLVLAIIIIVSSAALWEVYRRWTKQQYGSQPFAALLQQYTRQMFPPEPQLQETPARPVYPQNDLRQMREQDDMVLNSYGWVDRNAGIARIPIAEAMKLLAEKHLGPKEEPHPAAAPDLSASR